MPRPISWLIRLHDIRRAVADSVRSHYERKEIEALFQVQPRAAQLLLEMLPTTAIGRSRLVERQVLADFLDRIHKADDPSAELDLIRAQGAEVSRKKLRTLVRRDVEPLPLDSLPANIQFIPGQMVVSFRTIEDLAQTMYSLARAIETDGNELARRYEIREVADDGSPKRSEVEVMLQELSNLEATAGGGATPLRRPTAS
ncbi:hypothetical protein BH10ACI4_BH10ACI4_37410 [soil metagenome]